MDYDTEPPFEIARYREMQKALPGADALYQLMLAQCELAMPEGGRVLVAGAGGGREVEVLCHSSVPFSVTGVDPSADMLAIAQWYAENSPMPDAVKLVQGLCSDVAAPDGEFDAATSILVMHFLGDTDAEDGKRAYLQSIRQGLKAGALLIHVDISFENHAEREAIVPAFIRHAVLAGLDEQTMTGGTEMIASLPVISPARTEALLTETGFSTPQLFFRSLWYHAWAAYAE